MKNPLTMSRWSPYAAGAGIGVLSWATFLFMHKALGVSTAFARMAGAVEGVVAPGHVQANSYFAKYLVGTPAFEWETALVVALFFGALLAAWLAKRDNPGAVPVEHVPALWKWRFGGSQWLRYAGSFVGGAVLLFGARLAGGCTSGHGVSGGLQLALSSWVFLITMFAAGALATFAIFGWEGRNHV